MVNKKSHVPDRRVERTRRMLREALIALIIERGWEACTVQDVCDRADVGRSTFYMHFADKEELLVDGFDDLREHLRAHATTYASSAEEPLHFVRGMLEHAHQNHRLFLALVGKRTGHLVLQRFHDLVLDLIRDELGGKTTAKEATVRFLGGAFLELMAWWLDAPKPGDPAAVERTFQRMAAGALASASRLT